jgi:hypothetical protein
MTGHVRLMKAVRDMGLRTGKRSGKTVSLECQVCCAFVVAFGWLIYPIYQGSSIGTYSTQWMNEFHWSARGESAEDWLDIKRAHREKLPYPPVKIIFPSLKTVRATVMGEPVNFFQCWWHNLPQLTSDSREEVQCFAARINGERLNFHETNFTIQRARPEASLCTRRYARSSLFTVPLFLRNMNR